MEWLHKYALVAAINRSKGHLDQKEYQRAIEVCDRALARSPGTRSCSAELAAIHNNRGFACFRLKEYEAAIRDYDRALELHPRYLLTHRNRIHLFLARHEEQRALQATEILVAMLPQESAKQDARGHTLFHLRTK